jgi:hypothetical protein
LEDGKKIEIERAPTYYGQMSLTVDSKAAAGGLVAQIDMPRRQTPRRLLVRFRHPQGKLIQSVTVNGANWTDFDTRKEWVVIEKPLQSYYTIIAQY